MIEQPCGTWVGNNLGWEMGGRHQGGMQKNHRSLDGKITVFEIGLGITWVMLAVRGLCLARSHVLNEIDSRCSSYLR